MRLISFVNQYEALALATSHECVVNRVQLVLPTLGALVDIRCRAPAPNEIGWFTISVDSSFDESKLILSMLILPR